MILVDRQLGFWARKLLHITLNGTVAIAALFVPVEWVKPLTVLAFIAILIFESIRLKTKAKHYVHQHVGSLLKQEEELDYSGLFWAAVGALVIAQFASRFAISYGFAILAVSDAGAAIVGRLVPSKAFYLNKTWAGSIACFGLTVLVTAFYLSFGQIDYPLIPSVVFMGSVVTVLEVFSYPFDDNFLILVVSGYLMHLGLHLLA